MAGVLGLFLAALQLLAAGAGGAAAASAKAPPGAALAATARRDPAAEARDRERLENARTSPAATLAAARDLTARVPPESIDRVLGLDAPGRLRLLAGFGRAVGAATAAAADLNAYLAAWARQRGRALGGRGAWTPAEVVELAAEDLVDPRRFADDPEFRRLVVALLPRELDPATAPRLRDDLLLELERLPALDFAVTDEIESAWGAAPRRAADRLSTFGREPLRFDDDAGTPIAASIYSLPSAFFEAPVAAGFLAAVRAMAPEREILVLTDLPMRRRLAECCANPRLRLLETYGRGFTPWTRDPMSLTRRPDGGVMVLVRPNVQAGREEDGNLGAQLVRQLPPALDRAWGGVRWEVAPVPFHNGQVLLTREAAWISIHSLEPRILALLGVDRVPVATFSTAAGIERYFTAAKQAAAELANLYGRPVRFVHPLPPASPGGSGTSGSPASGGRPGDGATSGDTAADRQLTASRDLVQTMGGGAGYDLDSVLTLLPTGPAAGPREPGGPSGPGGPVALVASLAAGRSLLASLAAEDWESLRRGYDLAPPTGALPAALDAAQRTPAAAGLDAFLDLIATHLASQGFRIERLPLLIVPVTLLADHEGVAGREFLLTWNNVVPETRAGRLHAEGFSALLPAGDREARRIFTAAGTTLDLLPPLVHSIVLNGGYRCASNHLRASPPGH